MRLLEFFGINEARRNADHPSQQHDRNPNIGKKSLYNLLEPYNKPDYYMSFTDLPKAGINPTSNYDTPIGVYAYPVEPFYEMSGGDIASEVPFAGDRPYVTILKTVLPIMDVMDYNQADYDRDMANAKKLLGDKNFQTVMDGVNRSSDLRELKYINPKDPVVRFWKFCSVYSRSAHSIGYDSDILHSGKPTIRWTALLRRLGYNGFSDIEGTGLIHTNERQQAFFINPAAFTVETIIDTNNNKTLYYDKQHKEPPLTDQQYKELAFVKRSSKDAKKLIAYFIANPHKLRTYSRPLDVDTLMGLTTNIINLGMKLGPNAIPTIETQIELLNRNNDLPLKLSGGIDPKLIPYIDKDDYYHVLTKLNTSIKIPDSVFNTIIDNYPFGIPLISDQTFTEDKIPEWALIKGLQETKGYDQKVAYAHRLIKNQIDPKFGRFEKEVIDTAFDAIKGQYLHPDTHMYAAKTNPSLYQQIMPENKMPIKVKQYFGI